MSYVTTLLSAKHLNKLFLFRLLTCVSDVRRSNKKLCNLQITITS